MKICLAQARAVKGDVNANLTNHKKIIEQAALHKAEMIVFPELSLTGYEPALASELATTRDDKRFDELQRLSDSNKMIIGAGMPIRTDQGVLIGMILFQPSQPREIYFKQYIHPDEEPYFIKGVYQPVFNATNIALAICYEISVPAHAEQAHNNGAEIYIASVAKTVDGMNKAIDTLSATAKRYSMTVLITNCVGECEGERAGGRSSAWDNKGELLEQLNDEDEGLLIFDTGTHQVVKEQIEYSFSK